MVSCSSWNKLVSPFNIDQYSFYADTCDIQLIRDITADTILIKSYNGNSEIDVSDLNITGKCGYIESKLIARAPNEESVWLKTKKIFPVNKDSVLVVKLYEIDILDTCVKAICRSFEDQNIDSIRVPVIAITYLIYEDTSKMNIGVK